MCPHTFTAELFLTAKRRNNPSAHQLAMDKHSVVHSYTGILLSHENERSADPLATMWMDLENLRLGEKPETKGLTVFPFM